jgi:hypothetical protein
MAAEEKSNRLATSRRRYQLEQVLIQKGVAVKLQQLEEVEENTTQMARVLKKAPTWQHVPLVTKNRAALERKNLVLRRRAHQPEPTPVHAAVRPKMERTPSGGLLTKQRLLQVGVAMSEIRGLDFCRDALGWFAEIGHCRRDVQCLGFGVWGLGFGVWGLGFGVWGLEE